MELTIPKAFRRDPLFTEQFIEDYRGFLHSRENPDEVWVPVSQDHRGSTTYVPIGEYHENSEIRQRHDC